MKCFSTTINRNKSNKKIKIKIERKSMSNVRNDAQPNGSANAALQLSFVDFLPLFKRKNLGWFSQAGYESFSDLIKRINAWLKKNRKWKAISFETLAYDYENKNRRRSSLHNRGRSRNELRGLRMWIVLKDAQTAAQRIGCLVLSPKMKESAASRKSSNADVAASCLSSSHPPVPVPSSIGNIGKEAKDSTLRPDTVLFQRSTDEQKVTCQIGAKNPTGRLHIPNLIRQDRTSLAEVLFQAQTPFDTLDETLHNLNNYLIEDNLQGNFLSVECAETPLKSLHLNVDSVFFPSSMYGACDQVRVLRVFYEVTNKALEERLHCKDFVPKRIQQPQLSTGSNSIPMFESFDGLWKHVKAHFACNRKRHFLSAQTLYTEATEDGEPLDTKRMLIASSSSAHNQIRFLRVFYTTSIHTTECMDVTHEITNLHDDPCDLALKMHCKQFVPFPVGPSSRFNYEGLLVTKQRLESWVRRNEIRCMSAETVLVRLAGVGRRPDKVSQNCFEAAEHGRSDENFVTIFRVYYDGERVIENTNREVIPIEETSQIEPKQKKCVIH